MVSLRIPIFQQTFFELDVGCIFQNRLYKIENLSFEKLLAKILAIIFLVF
jgi:hypothetical protein